MAIFRSIYQEIISLNKSQRLFFLFITLCIFFIMGEYGATRPVSNSLVLSFFHSKVFPYLWIAIVPVNLFVVNIYNKYLVKFGCLNVFFISAFCVALINATAGFFTPQFPVFALIQYIWKDIYILLMLKQLWSIVHTTVDKDKAKYFYGFVLLFGSIGSLCGNMLPKHLALLIGSQSILYLSFPFYLFACIFYAYAYSFTSFRGSKEGFQKQLSEDKESAKSAFALFKESRSLLFILSIVILMQFSTAIIYYQFNIYLEQAFDSIDLRTQYGATLQSITNLLSIIFQAIGGIVFLQFIGLKRSHFLIPITFFLNSLVFLYKPIFPIITFFFAYTKALDFSLFTLLKEMLFVPLSINEKFRAKAFIDVFAYRTAKGGASLLLMILQIYSTNLMTILSILNLSIFLLWIFLVFRASIFISQKETHVTQL